MTARPPCAPDPAKRRRGGRSAAAQAAAGRDASLLRIALHPPFAFLRNYVLRRGFMAGTAGLVVSAMNSWYVFLKLAKLWERRRGA